MAILFKHFKNNINSMKSEKSCLYNIAARFTTHKVRARHYPRPLCVLSHLFATTL